MINPVDRAPTPLPQMASRVVACMPVKVIVVDPMAAMTRAHWRGNVRELEHAVESAVVIGRGRQIGIEDLPPECFDAGEQAGEPEDPRQSVSGARVHVRGGP